METVQDLCNSLKQKQSSSKLTLVTSGRNYVSQADGGGLMLFVREDIPCKLLSLENKPMEDFYVETNLRKTKWLLCCSYNASRSNIDFDLEHLN